MEVKGQISKAVLPDATDNDPESPVFKLLDKHGWPTTRYELDGLDKTVQFAKKESRNKIIKSILLAVVNGVILIVLAKL